MNQCKVQLHSKNEEKSDVYSFGVLLELITGKRPNDPSFGDNNDLVKWISGIVISSSEEGSSDGIRNIDLVQLIDPKLDPFSCDCGEIEKVLIVALLCTAALPNKRPSMRKVLDELLQDKKLASPCKIMQNDFDG